MSLGPEGESDRGLVRLLWDIADCRRRELADVSLRRSHPAFLMGRTDVTEMHGKKHGGESARELDRWRNFLVLGKFRPSGRGLEHRVLGSKEKPFALCNLLCLSRVRGFGDSSRNGLGAPWHSDCFSVGDGELPASGRPGGVPAPVERGIPAVKDEKLWRK